MLGTSTLIGTTAEGAHEGVSGGGGEAAQPNTNTNTNTTIMIGGEDEKAVSQNSGGGGGSAGGDLFESDRSTGGNRWPRQETLALLKIRSDMDVIFRDSSLKGPLWEEVSRKMAELGYHRSAKKCKEKFENVYKYHKRTKDGRVGKSDGKTYRFFDQLEALEQHHMAIAASQALPPLPQSSPAQVTPRVVHSQSQSQAPAQAAVPVTMVIPAGTNPASVTVPSSPHPISVVHTTSSINAHPQQPQVNVSNPILNQVPPHLQSSQVLPQQPQQHHQQQQQQQTMGSIPTHSSIQMENPSSPSATQSSSSTSSDEELIGRSRKRKRKWKDFFERLMKEVIEKQEDLQKRFLEAVEKREHDRVAREEAWKTQEMSRLNREHEILVQERSMAAAKDAALIAFLQKLSDQQQIPLSLPAQVQAQSQGQGQARAAPPAPVVASVATPTQPQPPPPQPQPQLQQQVLLQPQSQPQPQPQTQQPQPQTQINVTESQVSLPSPTPTPPLQKSQSLTQLPQQQSQQLSQALVVANTNNGDNGDFQKTNSGDNLLQASSSRWPKAEVQALINLRTNLDQKYQENGPKGPLWEEISAAMRKLGYNRNAKRCKEKWENINKYFKKVKESNKKRPEDSKTCPYFHQLDALYRERNKMEISTATTTTIPAFGQQQQQQMKHEGASMAPMMVQPEQQWPHANQAMDDQGSENQDDSEDDVDDEDDDDHGSGYEIVANNNNNVNAGSMSTTTAATRTATTE